MLIYESNFLGMEWIHQPIWSFVGGVVNILEECWILTTTWKFVNFNYSSPNIVHKIKVSWIMVSFFCQGNQSKYFKTCFLIHMSCLWYTVLCSSNEPMPVRWTNVMVTLPKWPEFLVCHHMTNNYLQMKFNLVWPTYYFWATIFWFHKPIFSSHLSAAHFS